MFKTNKIFNRKRLSINQTPSSITEHAFGLRYQLFSHRTQPNRPTELTNIIVSLVKSIATETNN